MAELSPGSVCITNLWAAITARSRLVHLSVKRFKQIAVFTTTFSGQNDFTAGWTVVSFHRRNNGGLPFIRYHFGGVLAGLSLRRYFSDKAVMVTRILGVLCGGAGIYLFNQL